MPDFFMNNPRFSGSLKLLFHILDFAVVTVLYILTAKTIYGQPPQLHVNV